MLSMTTRGKASLAGGLIAAVLAFAVPANATPVKWNFAQGPSRSSAGTGNTSNLGGCPKGNNADYGNTDQFTSGGKTIKAEAYHLKTGSNPFTTALCKDYLGDYSGYGLGVENLSSPQHTVDNSNGWDFIVFQLPADTYNQVTISLENMVSAWGTTGNIDATILYGTPDASLNISSTDSFYLKSINQLLAGGFSSMSTDGLFLENGIQNVTVTSTSPINYLIVAASLTPLRTEVDEFKVNAITGASVPVRAPEPATLAMFGSGLIGCGALAMTRRRRRIAGRA